MDLCSARAFMACFDFRPLFFCLAASDVFFLGPVQFYFGHKLLFLFGFIISAHDHK